MSPDVFNDKKEGKQNLWIWLKKNNKTKVQNKKN